MSEKSQEEVRKENNYIFSVGFCGGLFTSGLAYIAHFLNFIPFGPGVLLQTLPMYSQTPWMRGPLGHIIGILIISLLSIVSAYIYYGLFRKMDTPWVGIWYGLALWVIIFLGLNQMIPNVKTVGELGLNTNITFVSIFIIYGLFVGYSISFEHKLKQLEKES